MSSGSSDPDRPGPVEPGLIEVVAPARVHVTLIALDGAGERIDGGIGFAVDEPRLRLRIRPSAAPARAADGPPATPALAARLSWAAGRLGVPDTAAAELVEALPAHCGYGSATGTRLALLHGLARLHGLALSHEELVARSGRGGTSGIGVHTFRHGGLVVDGGHRRADKPQTAPSRFAEGKPAPPCLVARRPPEHWGLILARPRDAHGLEGEAERDFMAANTPLPSAEVHEVSHLVLMALLPALVEEDLPAFGGALTALQDVGWKRRHWQRPELARWRKALDLFTAAGAVGGGLSSTGPLLFALYDRTRWHGPDLCARIGADCRRVGLELESIHATVFGDGARVSEPAQTGAVR